MLPLHTAAPFGRQNTPSIVSTLIHTELPAHSEADADPLVSEVDDEPLKLVFVAVLALDTEFPLSSSLLPLAGPLSGSSSTEVDPLALSFSSGDHLVGSNGVDGESGDHSFGFNVIEVLDVLGPKRGIWSSPPWLLCLLDWLPLEEELDAMWAMLHAATSANHRCMLSKSLFGRGRLNAPRLLLQSMALVWIFRREAI